MADPSFLPIQDLCRFPASWNESLVNQVKERALDRAETGRFRTPIILLEVDVEMVISSYMGDEVQSVGQD